MRRRLYFVLPNRQAAEKLQDELLLARVEAGHMHFMGTYGANLGKLSPANALHKTDIMHGLWVGMVAGGLTGITIGLLLYFFQVLAMLGMGTILIMAIIGSVFGAWASGMVAISIPNSRLAGFQKQIESGQILLLLDVPKERIQEITDLIHRTHPEAEAKGIETTIPAFP